MPRIDPLRNFRYRLEIDNIAQAGFSEVSIAETTIDAVEYREGIDPPHVRKLSGLTKYGDITLKWGMTVGGAALDLYRWFVDVSAGQVVDKRKTVVIVAQDEAGNDAARFVVSQAWPTKYDHPDFKAISNENAVNSIVLANEGIERVA